MMSQSRKGAQGAEKQGCRVGVTVTLTVRVGVELQHGASEAVPML